MATSLDRARSAAGRSVCSLHARGLGCRDGEHHATLDARASAAGRSTVGPRVGTSSSCARSRLATALRRRCRLAVRSTFAVPPRMPRVRNRARALHETRMRRCVVSRPRSATRNTELGVTPSSGSGLRAARRCENDRCCAVFEPQRTDGRFCSTRCRVQAHRRRKDRERWERMREQPERESCCWRGDCECVRSAKRNNLEDVTFICPPIPRALGGAA